jgi:hypothetical protein
MHAMSPVLILMSISSGQDLEGDFGLNSLLSSEEFNGFCMDMGV